MIIAELPGEGHDTVKAASGFQLGVNVEDLTLLGDGDFSGIGNILANTIRGNLGDNLLDGGGGNDTVLGGVGHDAISGAGGADVLSGGNGDDEVRGGAGIDVMNGGEGNDRLFGGGGNDRLAADDGEDVLLGGMGRDVLVGGADADRFVLNRPSESPRGAGRDRVSDFSPTEGDQIDLSGMDADVTTGVDDGFAFIGTAVFSGAAGELRYSVNGGGHAIVTGDVDGDGRADVEILLTGTSTLSASDFLL